MKSFTKQASELIEWEQEILSDLSNEWIGDKVKHELRIQLKEVRDMMKRIDLLCIKKMERECTGTLRRN